MTLQHDPIRPVRHEVLGEFVFAEQWKLLMEAKPYWLYESREAGEWLDSILSPICSRADQRMATVAATFVTWLGSGLGKSFIQRARLLNASLSASQLALSHLAWVSTWAQMNFRQHGVSGGFRLIEDLLAAPEDFDERGDLQRCPTLSVEDYEVVDQQCAAGIAIEQLSTCDAEPLLFSKGHASMLEAWQVKTVEPITRLSQDQAIRGHEAALWAHSSSRGALISQPQPPDVLF